MKRQLRSKRVQEKRSLMLRSTLCLITLTITLTYGLTGGSFNLNTMQIHKPVTKVQAEQIVSPLAKYQLPQQVTPTQTAPIPPTQNASWDEFTLAAKRIAPIYDFPVKLLLAQAALESGHGTSHFALERNNYFGINAVDRNPNLANSFENVEQGIIAYILVIKHNFPEAWDSRDNPDQMVLLLEENSYGRQYASDPNYVQKLQGLPEWREN